MEDDEEFVEYEDRFDEFDIVLLKRGFFGESKHSKNISRPSKSNKVVRNPPRYLLMVTPFVGSPRRKESHFLSIKKAELKLELRLEQKARSQANFWKQHIQPSQPASLSPSPSPLSSAYAQPAPVAARAQPVNPNMIFEAPKSQYERELQAALKASAADKHASGLSMQNLLDLSSRELTPEDYEMLLLLDSQIEKKTTDATVLEALNETEADANTTGDCPICCCSFEAGTIDSD